MNFNEKYNIGKFEVDIIYNRKFTIFKIPNFLNKESYELLSKNFPKIENKKLDQLYLKKSLKYRFSSNDNNYLDLINNNNVLMNFHNEIFSFRFFFTFLKT